MQKIDCLRTVLKKNEPFAVALSGGTDSRVLVAFAKKQGLAVSAVTVDTGLNPGDELARAADLARQINVPFAMIQLELMILPQVRNNLPDRCYVCKRAMLSAIRSWAERNGCKIVVDGTHADDSSIERPGMKAAEELGIISPFAMCGMGKDDISGLARLLEVPVEPSSSCMATRFPEHFRISRDVVSRVREAESLLRHAGITGRLRVRYCDTNVIIEVERSQYERAGFMKEEVKKLGFSAVEVRIPDT